MQMPFEPLDISLNVLQQISESSLPVLACLVIHVHSAVANLLCQKDILCLQSMSLPIFKMDMRLSGDISQRLIITFSRVSESPSRSTMLQEINLMALTMHHSILLPSPLRWNLQSS